MLTIGDLVRVRAPFDLAFPGVYAVEGFDPERNAYALAGGVEFDVQYLEKVDADHHT